MPADSLQKGLVRMSWGARNLHSLWRLTYNPPEHLVGKLSFKRSNLTLFQQKWVSKRMLRAYHGDWIQERRLRRRFMPNALPPLEATSNTDGTAASSSSSSSRNASTSGDYNTRESKGSEASNRVPLASLMWREVEARLDVLLFRACFTHSAYDARRMITQGHVKLNGVKVHERFKSVQCWSTESDYGFNLQCTDPNIVLKPGDIFSVDPKEMYLLRPSDKPYQIQSSSSTGEEASEEINASEVEAASEAETVADPAENSQGGASNTTAETETASSTEGNSEAAASTEASAESTSAPSETSTKPAKAKKAPKAKKEVPGLPFDLPDYSAPFLFIPAYLEVSFPTCSAIYVRHPTARPGYSEIPTPYDADGEVMRLGWEYYKGVGRRRRSVEDVGDEDPTPAGALKDLYTEAGKRNWTANWEDTQLEKRHMRAVRQGRGRWAHRPL